MMFDTKCNVFFLDCGDFRPYFLIKDCKCYFFTGFVNVFLICVSLLCRRGRGRAARRGRRPLELLGHAKTR